MKSTVPVFVSSVLVAAVFATDVLSKPMSCRSWRGMEVPYLGDAGLDWIGGATHNGRGRAVIVLNPEILAKLSPLVRAFWLAHECGHHALVPEFNTDEEADCYAMRRLRKKHVRSDAEIRQLQEELRNLPEAVEMDAPLDPARLDALAQCAP